MSAKMKSLLRRWAHPPTKLRMHAPEEFAPGELVEPCEPYVSVVK
jgi:hypothetical protein